MKQLYYNNMAPRMAYRFQNLKFAQAVLNLLRLAVFKKPLRSGQQEMLTLIKQLSYGESWITRLSGYKNEIVQNVCTAMDEIPNLKSSLKKSVRFSDRRANMPSLIHLDLDAIAEGGKYDWQKIKGLLSSECGWVPPNIQGKNLHTSCCVEKAKDYSQFARFYNMKSTTIPFSALEIALASSYGNITREDAIKEINESLGLSLEPPKAHAVMLACNGCPMNLSHGE